MGQFNLLRFCSTRDDPDDLCSMLAKMFGVEDEDWWTKFRHSRTIEIPECVKRLLFERVKEMLEDIKGTKETLLDQQRKKHKDEKVDQEIVKDSMAKLDRFRTQRGEAALEGLRRMDLRWSLGDELQEGILTWHIATHVFLFKSNKAKAESAMPYVKAIGTLSSYMMFLLAFRPDMLPGLALRSLYKLTCQDLFRLSSDYRNRSRRCRSRPRRSLWDIIILGLLKRLLRWHGHPCSSRLSQGEETLASILCGDYSIVDAALEDEGEPNANGVPSSAKTANQQHLMNAGSIKSYIPLGSKLADELLRMEETETPGLDFLQAIFNVWVEMLLCSSYRCSRESHAKHLSNGGELTTVVWLTVEHAGLFPIDKDSKVEASIKPPPECGGTERPPHSSHIRVSPPPTRTQDECEATGIGHSEVNIRIYGLF